MYPSLDSLIGAGRVFAETKIRLLREELIQGKDTYEIPLPPGSLLAEAESVFRSAEANLRNADCSSTTFVTECAFMEAEIIRVHATLGLEQSDRLIERYRGAIATSISYVIVKSKSQKDIQ